MTDKRDTPPAETGRKNVGKYSMGYCCDGGPNGEKHSQDCRYNAAPMSPEPPLNVRLKGDKDKGRFCTHGVELIKWCKICDGAGTVGATPEPPSATEFWFDGQTCKKHKIGCCLDCMKTAAQAEAWKSVCDAAAQSLPSPAPQKERFEAYERTHGRGDMLQPHPGGYNNEGTQSRWNLWQAAASPAQPVGTPELDKLEEVIADDIEYYRSHHKGDAWLAIAVRSRVEKLLAHSGQPVGSADKEQP